MRGVAILFTFLLVVAGCGGGDGAARGPGDAASADHAAGSDEAAADTGADAADTASDEGAPDAADMPVDVGPGEPPWAAPDEVTRIATATGALYAPLGISVAGQGQTLDDDSPRSPLAKRFFATTSILDPPGVRVISLVRGDTRLILVQTDLFIIFGEYFLQVVERVRARTGVDLHESLVLMANHTHAGPARILDFIIGNAFADEFDAEIFEGAMASITDPIVAALQAEHVPVRFGHVAAQNAEMHRDRRCEDGEYTNDTMGILRFDAVDGGPVAVVVNYAMHGTVLSHRPAALSGDAPRFVELKVSEALEGAPLVLFAQSWAGDMAPGDPHGHVASPDAPAARPVAQADRLEALGRSAAETVLAAWDGIAMVDDPPIGLRAHDAPFDWEAMGYQSQQDFPYPHGGVWCGGTEDFCPGSEREPNMRACVPVPDLDLLPTQVRVSAARISDALMITLPGEPVTSLGEYALDRARELTGMEHAYLLGYAQEYAGYLVLPDDWAKGGYEAASNIFGPRQGVTVADAAASVAAQLIDPAADLAFEPRPRRQAAAVSATQEPYVPGPSIGAGAALEAPAAPGDDGVVRFTWSGGDPWVDSPRVIIEGRSGDGEFQPLTIGDTPLDSDHYRLALSLAPDPAWTRDAAEGAPRTFRWTAHLRTAARIASPGAPLAGEVRFRVTGQALDDEGGVDDYSVTSAAATIGSVP